MLCCWACPVRIRAGGVGRGALSSTCEARKTTAISMMAPIRARNNAAMMAEFDGGCSRLNAKQTPKIGDRQVG